MSLFVFLLACTGEFSGMLGTDLASGVLLGAHSDGDDAILAGGDFSGVGTLTRYNNGELCLETEVADEILWWIHGAAEGDWYAVGANGAVVHEANGQRTREDIDTTETLFGVFADASGVWAVSANIFTSTGTIWKRGPDGTWESMLTTPSLMFKVWNGWFIGDGLAYFYDGTDFLERHPPDDARLTTVRGRDANDVYAVGGTTSPIVLHWDGSTWETVEWEPRCGGQNGLNGVWTAPGEDVWVAGHVGTAARWDGDTWTCNEVPVTSDDFHFVWEHDGSMLFGGGNLFASADNHGAVAQHPSPKNPTVLGTCP